MGLKIARAYVTGISKAGARQSVTYRVISIRRVEAEANENHEIGGKKLAPCVR